jgi:hypothetical protein
MVEVGDTVRQAYSREWIGVVVEIEADDAYVRYAVGGQVHKHDRRRLFNEQQRMEY